MGLFQQIDNIRLECRALLFLQLHLEVRRLDEFELAACEAIEQIERVSGPNVERIAFESSFENVRPLLLLTDALQVDSEQRHRIPVSGVDHQRFACKCHSLLIETDGHRSVGQRVVELAVLRVRSEHLLFIAIEVGSLTLQVGGRSREAESLRHPRIDGQRLIDALHRFLVLLGLDKLRRRKQVGSRHVRVDLEHCHELLFSLFHIRTREVSGVLEESLRHPGIGLQGFLIVLDRVGLFVFPCEQFAPRHPGLERSGGLP